MGFAKKLLSKFYFKQWTIGIAEESITDIIRTKKEDINFTWLKTGDKMQSFADPFVSVDQKNGDAVILTEQFTTGRFNGKIAAITYSKNQGFSTPQTVISNGSHLSYPLIYNDNGRYYIIAENAYNTGVVAHEYNPENKQVVNKIKITSLPLVDATVLKKEGKYWLFATMLGKGVFNELHIFFADELLGPYHAHKLNPVKNDFNGARPAGNFIEVDGAIYRPSQNCADYYGKSITIQKISKLSTTEFAEEEYMHLSADNYGEFNLGVHTINSAGDFLVVDAQKGHFQPLRQIVRFFSRAVFSNKKKIGFYAWMVNAINAEICNFEMAGYYITENCVFI